MVNHLHEPSDPWEEASGVQQVVCVLTPSRIIYYASRIMHYVAVCCNSAWISITVIVKDSSLQTPSQTRKKSKKTQSQLQPTDILRCRAFLFSFELLNICYKWKRNPFAVKYLAFLCQFQVVCITCHYEPNRAHIRLCKAACVEAEKKAETIKFKTVTQ